MARGRRDRPRGGRRRDALRSNRVRRGAATMRNDRQDDRGKVPVSVLVPVKNEAENLRRCLPARDWADEVFVVDSQSTDDTALVAEEHSATVVQFEFNGF